MDLQDIAIADLHPTQLTLGFAEVEARKHKMAKLSEKELEGLLEKKAVPYVRGPGGVLYMVDHHHFCRIMLELGRSRVKLGECRKDWSDMALHPFWEKMERKGLCWPIDIDGNRRPCVKIPDHVRDLTDNPWRTLARGVRDRAYRDDDTPFQEFMWGNYYRSFMTTRLLDADIALAEGLAIQVSRLDEAQDLPGYLGAAA